MKQLLIKRKCECSQWRTGLMNLGIPTSPTEMGRIVSYNQPVRGASIHLVAAWLKKVNTVNNRAVALCSYAALQISTYLSFRCCRDFMNWRGKFCDSMKQLWTTDVRITQIHVYNECRLIYWRYCFNHMKHFLCWFNLLNGEFLTEILSLIPLFLCRVFSLLTNMSVSDFAPETDVVLRRLFSK